MVALKFRAAINRRWKKCLIRSASGSHACITAANISDGNDIVIIGVNVNDVVVIGVFNEFVLAQYAGQLLALTLVVI